MRELIKQHEGFRGTPYKDTVGATTIGWGHNLDASPLTPPLCEPIFEVDIAKAEATANALCPSWAFLDPVRQAVVTECAFVLGANRLAAFRAFFMAIESKDWGGASYGLINSRWHDQAPKRVDELAQMMKTGEWPGEVSFA
jgi:lysozyme